MSLKEDIKNFILYRRHLKKFKTEGNEVLFRPHGSTLKDCLKSVVIVSSKEDLCKIFNEKGYLLGEAIVPKDINVKPYCYDSRIDWGTYIVTVRGMGLGFTNGPVE